MTKTRTTEKVLDEAAQGIGAALAPLFTWRGMAVYPLFGAEGDDDNDGEPNSGSAGDDDDEDTGEGTTTSNSDTVSRAEFDKLRNQLSAADKRRDEAEKRLKDIDDSKKDELTKANEKVTELTESLAQRDQELAEMRLQNAFLTADTGITWHDPADALALAERQGYLTDVVGEDGKVDVAKLRGKLQELAKAKPHLVSKGSEETEKTPKPSSTGRPVGSKGSNTNKGGDAKIPARYQRFLNK